MQMSKNKLEAIILIVLIVGLAGVALYFYVIKPRNETITSLTSESKALSARATTITKSVNGTTSINNALTEVKGEAMEYSAKYLSGGAANSENFDKIYSIVETIFDDGEISSYRMDPNPYATVSSITVNVDGEKVPVYNFKVYFRYTFANYSDLMDSFADIADNYVYLYVEKYTLSDPSAEMYADIYMQIHMLECNLEAYTVGTCPCILENGEVCGQYNEFDADTCINCRHSIDNCPNSTCGVLIELNEDANVTTCPVCEEYLKKCQYCGQYMLRDSDQCSKCGKIQE